MNNKTYSDWTGGETLTFEKMKGMLEDFAKIRKRSEFEINGVTINVADYEEVSANVRQYVPAGFRVLLNVRRTIYAKTFDPLPTDLLIFDMRQAGKHTCVFAGGHKKEWKPLWNDFIDEQRITSKEKLLMIAAARSPSDGNKITEDSRQHLEAEIFAKAQGKIKFSELEKMEDWRLAYLYKEMFVDKKPIENL